MERISKKHKLGIIHLMIKGVVYLIRKPIFLFSIFFSLLLTGCGLKTQTLNEFYDNELSNISKIVILNGNTGEKKSTVDKERINTFLAEIKNIKFIPEENQEDRDGFNYSISLFDENKKTFQFGPTFVNENYYYTNPDIHPIIDNFYESLKENSSKADS
jgi:hypothetical protein